MRFAAVILATVLVMAQTAFAGDPREITWEELAGPVPEDVQAQMDAMLETDEMDILSDEAFEAKWTELQDQAYPVIPEMDGQTVRIPGFVVPTDLEANEVREFLLVPYLGACIHVPPPPPNQVIYVKTDQIYNVQELFDPVWVTGKLNVDLVSTDLAEAGYVLDADTIIRYEVD
ncbi:DUF3299 domain-containing protein [Magnetovibrio sp. PR-2]|uniref:DUF3299 domain-containing protein n=1 Tax=Magnetovibrio sp. PR-2 TaxID=3120356 RepID=UPI002FCE07E3